MNQRAAYLFQILEKIGAPLLAAAGGVTPSSANENTKSEASVVAELLARSVQAGVELAGVMDIREAGAEGEAIRLALSGLSSPLIAGHYRNTGKVPGEQDVKRMVTALSAALTFADNFSPAAGNTTRLATLEAGMPPADDTQAMIQCLQALTPIVLVIATYPFGRPEKKIVQDVTERLVQKAGLMAVHLLPGAAPADLKLAELTLLRAMAPLYCEAHKAETRRLMALDDNARNLAAQANGGVLPLDPVWQDFDRQIAMLGVLGQTLLASFASRPVQASGSVAGPANQAQPLVVEEISAPVPLPPPAAAPAGPYNPMAFFKPGQAAEPPAADGENT